MKKTIAISVTFEGEPEKIEHDIHAWLAIRRHEVREGEFINNTQIVDIFTFYDEDDE